MTDEARDRVSVLVPTVEWTPACDDLLEGLRDGEELLVICDSESDPVADRETPDGVEILVAGEPVGCSGKANAMAYGIERAGNDRFVWTDADFRRDDDWLDRLVAEGEKHGPATAIPYFYGAAGGSSSRRGRSSSRRFCSISTSGTGAETPGAAARRSPARIWTSTR